MPARSQAEPWAGDDYEDGTGFVPGAAMQKCLSSKLMHDQPGDNTSVPNRIFTMWDQMPLPAFIAANIASWHRANPRWPITLLTLDNVQQHGLDPPPMNDFGDVRMSTVQRLSDWYRVQAVAKYGGVWMEATTISFAPIESWVDPGHQGVTGFVDSSYREAHIDVYSSSPSMLMELELFAAPPRHPLMVAWQSSLGRAFSMGFQPYMDSIPVDVAAEDLHRGPFTSNVAAVAWRQAAQELGVDAQDLGVNAPHASHVVRLHSPPIEHEQSAFLATSAHPDYKEFLDCDAVAHIFECTTAECTPLRNSTHIKISNIATACVPCLGALHPVGSNNMTSYLASKLVADLNYCADLVESVDGDCSLGAETSSVLVLAIALPCILAVLVVGVVTWQCRRQQQLKSAHAANESTPLAAEMKS